MGSGNQQAFITVLLMAPILAVAGLSSFKVEALEQQQQQQQLEQRPLSSDDMSQGLASRDLLDSHKGTYTPTFPVAPTQPTNSVNYDGNTYQLYGLKEEDWKTFDMASEDCRSRRMNLATFSGTEEHQSAVRPLVEEYLNHNAPDYSNLKFWVGYKNMGISLMSVGGGDIGYVAARLEGSNTCVHANRTAGDLQTLPTDNSAFTTTSCMAMYPYMCEMSPCSICNTCIEKIREDFTSHNNFGSDTAAAIAAWTQYCNMQNEYSDAQCDEATQAIAGSINVAGRPAALCGLLGDCKSTDECDMQIVDGGPTEVEDVAFCTDTGVESGSLVGANVITNLTEAFSATDDECLTSDDCDAGEFCDSSGDASVNFCNANDGSDSKVAKGSNECPAGFTCDEALGACQFDFECNVVNGEPVLSGSECPGMCFRVALQVEDGIFTNEADAIMVKLNDLAQAFTPPCEEIFDDRTMQLLGSATCSVSEEERDMVMIHLSGDATVDVGNNISVSTSQGTLRGYADSTNIFAGLVSIKRCESCTPPTPVLTGLASIREPCSVADGDFGYVFIDGSSSFSVSGRGLMNYTRGLDIGTAGCANSDELQNVVTQASENSREFLELDNFTLTDMAENVNGGSARYCITLAVEDFLSESSEDAKHTFEIQSANSATPGVDVVLVPGSTTISTGLVLSGSVDTSSLCSPDEVAEYKWECEATDGRMCPLLVDPQYTRSIVREITFSDLLTARVAAGASYRFALYARLNDASVDGPAGITEPAAPQASQVIGFEADPLVALFTRDSPSGDYVRQGTPQLIVFDASASYDPSDPEDSEQPMSYTFSCQRPDGISACFISGGISYTGDVNGAQWTVDLNKFANDADGDTDIFIMRVEVVKAGRKPGMAARIIRLLPQSAPTPVRARINHFCDGPCPAASLSSEPLSFSADILNEGELPNTTASYSWTVNGATVGASNLAGDSLSANAASITIQGDDSILPRSGVIDISCTAIVGDARGSTQATVRLEGAPICTNPNVCLIVTGAGNPPSQTFPGITYRVQARGFSASNARNYEFGFLGSYTVYVVAIDSRNGGRGDGTANSAKTHFTLEDATDVDQAADGGASELDFEVLENTGSKSAVHSGMQKANAFKNAKADAGGGGGRRLLAMTPTKVKTTEGLQATLRTLDPPPEGNDVRVADALGALAAISKTNPSDTEQAILLAQIVRNTMHILDSNEFDGIGAVTVQQALSRLGLAANILSEMCIGNCFANADDHWEIAMMVESTLDAAREVMSNSAASGITTVAISAPIALAVSRNTIRATSTADVVFDAMVDGTTQATGARFEDDTSANQFVNYCEDIDPECASQERVALYLSHVTNPAVYTNSTNSFPSIPGIMDVHLNRAALNPMATSGVLRHAEGTSQSSPKPYALAAISFPSQSLPTSRQSSFTTYQQSHTAQPRQPTSQPSIGAKPRCSSPKPSVAAIPFQSFPTSPEIQLVDSVSYRNKKYQLYGLKHRDMKTFDEASEDCRSRRMALATISSRGEHESAVQKLVNEIFDLNADLKPEVLGGLQKHGGWSHTLPTDNNVFTTASCMAMYPYMCEMSPCSICDTFIEKIREEFTSQNNFGSDAAAAIAAWPQYCNMQNEYSDAQCDEATQAIAGSVNVAGRPAASCGLLGACDASDECEVQVVDGGPTEVEDVAFCTDTGMESGSIVGADVITNLTTAFNATDDDCLTSDDCDAGEFCDFSGDLSVDFCGTEDGLDSKVAKGVCTTKCELPFVKEAQRPQNLLFSDEDVCNVTAANHGADECPAGFTREEALDSCRVNFECNVIDGEAVLNGTECPGMCFRVALQLGDGNFTNDADAIMVKLNDLARAFTAPCEEIFDDSSMELLGSATCSVSAEERDMLKIQMSGDATVDVGSNLTLSSSQDTLRGYAGSTIVDRCDSCTPPTPVLTGPASIREPCSGGGSNYGTFYIDGSSSFSASCRGVTNFTWGLDTASNGCASSDALQNVITKASENSREFLELDNSTLTDMAENVPESGGSAKYCITLAVEDFLSKSEMDAEHNFMIQSTDSATPNVDVAEYKWECEATDGGTCPLLVDPEYSRSIVREITFSDLLTARITAGSSYRFLLSARLNDTSVDGPDGTTEPSAPQASQVIGFEADPLVALFTRDSPSGGYKRPGASQLITFDASASYDPSDPENSVQPMRYTFSCQRPDGISDCFVSDEDGLYTGDVNGAQWTVDLNKFVNDNNGNKDIFIMQVEVVKANREPATTTSTFSLLPQDAPTPVRTRVNQFSDGQCPAASPSSEPLPFSVDILNEDELTDATPSYSWTVNGVTVAASNLAGASPSADAASITIQGGDSILPRSGVIDVSCTVSVGDATGSAQTTVRLEGAPICTNPNGCLIVTGAGNPPTKTFPDIGFRVQARGFSGANALNYEFGFVDAEGNLQFTRVADSSPAADLDAQQGSGREYTVYVKAMDSRNGGSSDGTLDSAQATFMLEEATDVDQAANEGAPELDFEVLENTGSKSAVHSGMKKANAFKNAKANAGGSGGRRLLDNHVSPTEAKTTEGLQATLRTLEGTNVRVADALGALSAVSETTPSDTEQALQLSQIVRDAMQILDSNEFDSIGTVAVRQALSRLGLAANMLSEMCTGNCFTDTDDHWMIAMMVESTLDAAREVMSNSAASGVTTVAISTPIALAVSRNTIRATSTASVVFDAMVDGTTQATGARFEDDTSANQFVNYCEDIDPECASQERLALYLSHVTNPAIYTNSTNSFPGIPGIMDVHLDGAASEPMAISAGGHMIVV
ncbi:hypothetical protein DUNSADRAFT_12359 [Dunaliella salina]|uniref:C-type lectin domain-containing protein n=1 Tax=Dunaliella salina TaxID=3046 RepID=A0ABQ7GBF3_DUNSA|nr:hypothetical protein DUNSADRAFT_12359 [Dunaliella salina]|eukprot:KAF5831944.1 hypothetical protein DUNSADRAFT_12359 [Dunaliella salina]